MTDNSARRKVTPGLIPEPPGSVSALAQRIWAHHAITPGVTSSAFSLRLVQRFGRMGDGRLPLLATIQRRRLPGGGRFANLEPSLLYLRLAQAGPEISFATPIATAHGLASPATARRVDSRPPAGSSTVRPAASLPAPSKDTVQHTPENSLAAQHAGMDSGSLPAVMRVSMTPALHCAPGSATIHGEPPPPPTSRTPEDRPQNQVIPPETPSAPESASHHAAVARPVSRRAPASSDEGQDTQTAALQTAELAGTAPMPAAAGASFRPVQRAAQAMAQTSRSLLITGSQSGELGRAPSRSPSPPPQLAGLGRQSHLPPSGQSAAPESHPGRAAVPRVPAAPQGLARQVAAPASGAPAAIQLRRAEGPTGHSMAAAQASPLLSPRLYRSHEPAGLPTLEQHPSGERAANLRASQGQSESATLAASAELSTRILQRRQPDPEEPAHRTSVATARSSSSTPRSTGPVAQPAALSYRKVDRDAKSVLVQTGSADRTSVAAPTIPAKAGSPAWPTLASPLRGTEGRQLRSSEPLVADELPVAVQKPAVAGLQAAALSARAASSGAHVSLPVAQRYPAGSAAQRVPRQATSLEPTPASAPLNLYRQALLPGASPVAEASRLELLAGGRIAAQASFQPGLLPDSRPLTTSLPWPPAHAIQRAHARAACADLPFVASPGPRPATRVQASVDAQDGSAAPAPGPSVEPGAARELPTMTAESPGTDVRQLADQVYEILVQRLATERERRGL